MRRTCKIKEVVEVSYVDKLLEAMTPNRNVEKLLNQKNKIDEKNSKKFSTWILKGKMQTPNFFDAKRIHLIINKMIISSKKKKNILIN